MPIKAENRSKYPKEWPLISRLIRKYRAGDRCECTVECDTRHDLDPSQWDVEDDSWRIPLRCSATNGEPHPITGSKVVLTVAHLDHNPANNRESNLKAMCQRCHNRLNSPHRRRNAAKTRRKRYAVGEMCG